MINTPRTGLFAGKIGRGILLLIISIVTGVSMAPRSAAEQEMPKVLHVGFSAKVLPELDQRDAQVAMELWSRELTRRIGISADVTIFHDAAALNTAIRNGQLHFVTLSSVEYLQSQHTLPIIPVFVAACKTGPGMKQLLIVRRDSGIRNLKDLKGKTLVLPPAQQQETARIWLDVLTLKQAGEPCDSYFRALRNARKASQAVMSVFFRQADAAVVSRASFEGCVALNPQLGKDLSIIQESQSLLGHFGCVPVDINRTLKLAMEDAAFHMSDNAVGRQVLTLFQVDTVVPFKPSFLDGIQNLLSEQSRLKARRRKS